MLQLRANAHHQVPRGFITRSDIGLALSAKTIAYALCCASLLQYPDHLHREARRGEESEVDPEQLQDPDNEYGLFAGTTYETDDEEADKIYGQVDKNMDARRRARRFANIFDVTLFLVFTDLFTGKPGKKLSFQNTAQSDRSYSNSLISSEISLR